MAQAQKKSADLSLAVVVKLLNVTQVREKSLKILQYAAKLCSFLLLHYLRGDKDTAKRWKQLAKTVSTGRRLFKLLRWLQYLQSDLPSALKEKEKRLRRLLLIEFGCNMVADTMQDFVTLDRIGLIPKGIVPPRLEYYADCCELVLSLTSLACAFLKIGQKKQALNQIRPAYEAKEGEKKEAEKRKEKANLDQMKLFLLRLSLLKYGADFAKALCDTEVLKGGESEGLQSVAGMISGAVSTHKYIVNAVS